MEIYFKEESIGTLENIYREEFWIHGNLMPNEAYYKYKDFFDAMVCEDEEIDENLFDSRLFKDSNWLIKIKEEFQAIFIPAIYEDGYVSVRCKKR